MRYLFVNFLISTNALENILLRNDIIFSHKYKLQVYQVFWYKFHETLGDHYFPLFFIANFFIIELEKKMIPIIP